MHHGHKKQAQLFLIGAILGIPALVFAIKIATAVLNLFPA